MAMLATQPFMGVKVLAEEVAPTSFASGTYYSGYGSEDFALRYLDGSHRKCFTERGFFSEPGELRYREARQRCRAGIKKINSFAIEYKGYLYCHDFLTPGNKQVVMNSENYETFYGKGREANTYSENDGSNYDSNHYAKCTTDGWVITR